MYRLYLVTECLICNSTIILKMFNKNNVVGFDKIKTFSVWLDYRIIYLRKHETNLCQKEIILHSCKNT